MDLLRRLEPESVAAGGRVHVLLGNHEVMNLFRDTRYVDPGAYRHFASDESKADRRAAVGKYRRFLGGEWSSEGFRDFNRRFPKGFIGRQKSLDPDGEYGSWLLRLPAIVKINGVAYLHGGLSEEFAALGVDGINRRVHDEVRRHLESRQALESAGAISNVMNLGQILMAATELVEARYGGRSVKLRKTARALLDSAESPVLGGQGPLWYRGNALLDERLERDTVGESLKLVGATAMVVAHSPTTDDQITSRFHGQLFRIDHGINGSQTALALVSEGGETLVLDSTTRRRKRPVRELPVGQLASSAARSADDGELHRFLSESPVIMSRDLGRGSTRPRLIVMEREGEIRRGIFKTVDNDDGTDRYQHEVAAYRLDRAIGLGMVPVTVLRTLDGQVGSLQSWVDGAVDREAAEAYELDLFEAEANAAQLARGELFDALIGNAGRKSADVLCLVDRHKVLLVDHSRAFSASPDLPAGVDPTLTIPESLAEALANLDRKALDKDLGKLISDAQIDALLERRDKILSRVEVAVTGSP
jgi:hypothetical protein